MTTPTFTCSTCHHTTSDPKDVRDQYCTHCRTFEFNGSGRGPTSAELADALFRAKRAQ